MPPTGLNARAERGLRPRGTRPGLRRTVDADEGSQLQTLEGPWNSHLKIYGLSASLLILDLGYFEISTSLERADLTGFICPPVPSHLQPTVPKSSLSIVSP